MKRYLIYELKRNLFVLGCLTVFSVVIYLSTLVFDYNLFANENYTHIEAITAIGGILAAAVPLEVFSYKMKKRSLDLYYALPLTHRVILTVKVILGLIMVFVPYTAAYWLGAATAAIKVSSIAEIGINGEYYVACYFASIIPMAVIFFMTAFAFTRAKRATDGVIFVVFWAVAAAAVMSTIEEFTAMERVFLEEQYFLPMQPLVEISDFFSAMLSVNKSSYYYNLTYYYIYVKSQVELAWMCAGYIFTGLCGIGSAVGLFLTENKTKAENVGQISDSYFGYKTMLPILTVCLFTAVPPINSGILFYVMIITAVYLMYCVYRRTAKIGLKQAVIMAIPIVIGIIFNLIVNADYMV